MGKNISFIYSSPILRARKSAEIVRRKLGLSKIHFSKELLEVKSSLQGQPESYLASINYNVFATTGETLEDLSNRMQKFVARITKLHKGKNIAAVSHGDPIMIIRAKIAGLPIINDSIRPGRKDYIKPGEIYSLII